MQIESLIKQSASVGLSQEELAQFLATWGGTPAEAGVAAEPGQSLDGDENQIQSDMSADDMSQSSARPPRRAVKPGLPPRVARWEQMRAEQDRGRRQNDSPRPTSQRTA